MSKKLFDEMLNTLEEVTGMLLDEVRFEKLENQRWLFSGVYCPLPGSLLKVSLMLREEDLEERFDEWIDAVAGSMEKAAEQVRKQAEAK